ALGQERPDRRNPWLVPAVSRRRPKWPFWPLSLIATGACDAHLCVFALVLGCGMRPNHPVSADFRAGATGNGGGEFLRAGPTQQSDKLQAVPVTQDYFEEANRDRGENCSPQLAYVVISRPQNCGAVAQTFPTTGRAQG